MSAAVSKVVSKVVSATLAGVVLFLAVPTVAFSAPAAGSGLDLSGSADTTLTGRAASGGAPGEDDGDFSYRFEEYANLRLRARVGERGTFYGAVNFIAAAGHPVVQNKAAEASGLFDSPFLVGENYAAAVEPERLYLRVEGDSFDLETGLMRLAFGYGQAWSPTDFMGKRNPLLPDARPRGILAVAATAYPSDKWKLKAFSAAGSDPEQADGSGGIFGASADFHGDAGSVQALYAWEAGTGTADVHRIGLSVKVDVEIGLALDALYTAQKGREGLDGLEAAAGADYSFLNGDLYVLAQYLYNGGGRFGALELTQTHYLYGSLLYRINDYTSAGLDCAASLEDGSASPALTFTHEPFQGLTLSLSGRVPMDARTFLPGELEGELGPRSTGARALITAKIKAKF